jgi:hypothetical protein
MIINLIFVALMCYYFKRKYDYLEVAQNEQAKILYQLIHKPATCPVPCMDFSRDPLTQLKHPDPDPDPESDSESDSDDESVESVQNDFVANEIKDIKDITDLSELNVEEVKTVELDVTVEEVKLDEPLDITLNVEDTGNAYSKMSMKQLKDLLSSKGIKPKNNIRKDELIEILSKEIS